jgi:hypothetical protein
LFWHDRQRLTRHFYGVVAVSVRVEVDKPLRLTRWSQERLDFSDGRNVARIVTALIDVVWIGGVMQHGDKGAVAIVLIEPLSIDLFRARKHAIGLMQQSRFVFV